MLKEKENVKKGYKIAQKITQKEAKSFYFASFFLSRRQKKSAYAIYALCRLSDNAVDQNHKNKKELLEQAKKKIKLAYSQENLDFPLLAAFAKTVQNFSIPQEYFLELIQGMEVDLKKTNYANWGQLYDYCYKAAGVVGLIMLCLFGYKDEKAKKYAVSLGIAMQLTNILRDIKEDFQKKRIYLPQTELEKFKINTRQIKKETVNYNFVYFMKFQIDRARQYYRKADEGIKLIKGWRCRLTVLLMKNIYAAILCQIEKNNYNVFQKRAYTSFVSKILICLLTLFSFRYQ